MSIVCLNSKDQNPNEFFNQFPSGIILPKNSEVCCFGWSANLKDVSGVTVTSENDTFYMTLAQESTRLLFPFIEFKITHRTYQNENTFIGQLNIDMNKRLQSLTVATIPISVVASLVNGLVVFEVKFVVSSGAVSYGEWSRWLGEAGGVIEIDPNNARQAITPGPNTLSFVDKKPLYPITNQTAAANVGANFLLNLVETPQVSPIGGLGQPFTITRRMTTPTPGGGGSLTAPNPGDIGIFWTNNNGLNNYGIPIAQNETNHWGGQNGTIGMNCLSPQNVTDLLFAMQNTNAFTPGVFTNGALPPVTPNQDVYITVRSTDPTRNGLFVQGKINSIYSALPSTVTTPWDDPNNQSLILTCTDISSNINEQLPIPGTTNTNAPRARFYFGEIVEITIESGTDVAANALDVVGGILTSTQLNYFQKDVAYQGNPSKDWTNAGLTLPNTRAGADVLFGFRIDADRNLVSIKGNVDNYEKEEAVVVNLPSGATSLEVCIEPVVVQVNNVPTLELQLNYDIGATGTFTPGPTLRPSEDNNFYARMPFHQAVAFANPESNTVIVAAIHHGDINTGAALIPNPFRSLWAFAPYEKNRATSNKDWKDTIRRANAKQLLGMVYNEAAAIPGAVINGSYAIGDYRDLPTNVLIQVPDLPITSFIGGADGMWGNVVRQASGLNIHNPSDIARIYEQFPTDTWLELKNQDDINLTQLSCRITDNHNVLVDFLEPNTSVFLKFRRKGQQDKLGGF